MLESCIRVQLGWESEPLALLGHSLYNYVIQYFEIGDIIFIKVPREDRTSTDNRRLFGRILEEPYSHRYKILTSSGVIKRLIPTKELGIVDESLWSDIIIPTTTATVTLAYAAKEASTSIRVGISCQCKGNCNSKRCKCHKEGRQCTIHCHQDDHDCGNLSELTTRTEITLVERLRRKRARADTIGNRGQSRTARAIREWVMFASGPEHIR